jgi:plastocyanin
MIFPGNCCVLRLAGCESFRLLHHLPSSSVVRLAAVSTALLSTALTSFGDSFSDRVRQSGVTPPITILDAEGHVSRSAAPSTSGNTVDVTVAPNFSLTFSPSTVNILVGDTVRWTWAAGGHTVTSGSPCTVDSAYCSPNDTNCSTAATSNTGAVYTHTFNQAGTFSYFCRIHCGFGMTGTVNVTAPFVMITSVTHNANGFTISGLTNPNTTITIQSSPDLVTQFQSLSPTTANASGVFTFTDMTALPMRFYRATYP